MEIRGKFILKILIILVVVAIIAGIVELVCFMNDDIFWDAVTPDTIEDGSDYLYDERY
tara:strand:+ start:803 stop:976 length:174 start_codon:yes stop_codon:yes gene_type:complete